MPIVQHLQKHLAGSSTRKSRYLFAIELYTSSACSFLFSFQLDLVLFLCPLAGCNVGVRVLSFIFTSL